MECHACGAELDPRDKFCSKCGAITERGEGAGVLAGRYAAELADGLGKLFAVALGFVTNSENRKTMAVGGGVALVLLISLTSNPISRGVGGLFSSVPDGPAYNDDGKPNFAEYEDVFVGDETEYLITGPANIRDFPTSQSTRVVGSLAEGQIVMAREVQAFDPDSQWLKLTTGGYVWGSNLIAVKNETTEQARAPVEFPDALEGLWTDRQSCDEEALNFVSVSDNEMNVNGLIYTLNTPNGATDWPAEYSVFYSGPSGIHTDIIVVNISADGQSITVTEGDTGEQPNWLRDDGLLGCSGRSKS